MSAACYTVTDIANVYKLDVRVVLETMERLGLKAPLSLEEAEAVRAAAIKDFFKTRQPQKEKKVTKKDAAKKLGVSVKSVEEKLKKGQLKGDGQGGVTDESVDALAKTKSQLGEPNVELGKQQIGEDELEERRRKEAVTPTEQSPILPIGTNQLLDTEETKELDETVKATDPFGYFEEPEKSPTEDDIPLLKTVKEPYVSLSDMRKIVAEATQKAYSAGYLDGEEAGRKSIEIISVANLEEFNGLGGVG